MTYRKKTLKKKRKGKGKRETKYSRKYRTRKGGGVMDSVKNFFSFSGPTDVSETVESLKRADNATEVAKVAAQNVLDIQSDCLKKVLEAAENAQSAAQQAQEAALLAQQIADEYKKNIEEKSIAAENVAQASSSFNPV